MIQYLLGYEPGNIDGKFTPKTRTALSKFQMNFDLPITGKLNQSTFQALELEVQNKLQSTPPLKLETASPPPQQLPSEKPRERKKPDKPPVRVFTDIQTVGVYLVAAYLADAGYFQAPLKKAKLKTVKVALKSFQLDIGVPPSGILDDVTWNKLQSIKLSSARQAELEAVAPIAQKQAAQPRIEYSIPADKPEKTDTRILDPAMPYFTLETG
ncbi:Peptidoglycan binding-like domain protein [Candidatus Thiomargarita nelsonii]|uniref:Peptidoglycan binding-like domain protein n=1 Tax=Candidatus Thiomargarita nelsonii TaxID=1003181 RepID=A0A176RUT6_9GAMM|nr:Peptidoglycan binding-like domain protein [Candidatus Thiomargarita nelsonii]